MKVAVIGDIHGTTKFLDCYMKIQQNDPKVDKIIVLGDWFDPYDNIDLDIVWTTLLEDIPELKIQIENKL
jgi:predicted phosphodiesterase